MPAVIGNWLCSSPVRSAGVVTVESHTIKVTGRVSEPAGTRCSDRLMMSVVLRRLQSNCELIYAWPVDHLAWCLGRAGAATR